MKIECVVFDMAGTTIDEDNIVYKTLHKSILEEGVLINLDDVLEHGAGKEKLNAINDILKIFGSPSQINKSDFIFTQFLKYLEDAYNNFSIKPILNAEEVLLSLRDKNIKVVLNTGYDRNTALKLLNKLSWVEKNQYDLLVTASDVANSRPAPDMILKAMHHLLINDSERVIKVGDSAIDIEEGQNAKCLYTIGVTTGAQKKEQIEKANPSYIFDNLKEVLQLIQELNTEN